MDPAVPSVLWVEPSLEGPSGGSRYNERVQAELEAAGCRVIQVSRAADWPAPSRHHVEELLTEVAGMRARHPGSIVIVDGLIGGCVPELFAAGDAALADALLVHLPLTAEPDAPEGVHQSEGEAVRSARTVIATSHWAEADLRARHRRHDVLVAEPGVERPVAGGAALAPRLTGESRSPKRSSRPWQLAIVGAITPRKNHALLGRALRPLRDYAWELAVIGPGASTPFGHRALSQLEELLPGRIRAHGALSAEQVGAALSETDLLLLPSLAETYGMVVTEAAVHSVPSFVSAGTGAQEAQDGAGRALPSGDPGAWTDAFDRWFSDPGLREALRAAAVERGAKVPTWQRTAQTFSTLAVSLRTGWD